MMAAIVVPARSCSIARTCACLVPARVLATAPEVEPWGIGRLDDLRLVFAGRERVRVVSLDFLLGMGSSKVCATPSAAPPQPHPGKWPGGVGSKSAHQRIPVPIAMLRLQTNASPFRAR